MSRCEFCGEMVDWDNPNIHYSGHTCKKDGLEKMGSTQRLDSGMLEAYAPKIPKDKVQQLPTAQQAKEMVDKGVNDKANEELEYITKMILTAISNNQTYVTGSGTLMQRTKEQLKDLGYKVDSGSQYNESYYSIKW